MYIVKVSFKNFILQPTNVVQKCTTPFLGKDKSSHNLDGDVFERSTKKEAAKVLNPEKKHNPGAVKRWARNLEVDAEQSMTVFTSMLIKTFWQICEYEFNGRPYLPEPGKDVGHIKMCVKDQHSIFEKMLTKNSTTEQQARESIQDAIRGRIILRSGTRAEGDEVLKKLAEAVKKRNIEIKKIKYYNTNNKKLDYVSTSAMSNLIKEINDKYGEDSYSCTTEKKKSGYNGIHIIFKVNNDFDAELQIMGPEVEKFKDVEDVFYKLRHGKRVNPKYNHIANKYGRLSKDDKERLESYIRECYIAQRQKELGIYEGKENEDFVPLDPKYKLPKEFDFNYIASL